MPQLLHCIPCPRDMNLTRQPSPDNMDNLIRKGFAMGLLGISLQLKDF